jgi:hypothetical protein
VTELSFQLNSELAAQGWIKQLDGAGESPEPGDVVAQRISFSDAGGHVMIVGPDANTFIGSGSSAEQPSDD